MPSLVVDLGPLGLAYLLQAGGIGYFRLDAAWPHLESGLLERVPDAPEFPYAAYAVFSETGAEPSLIEAALGGLRQLARELGQPSAPRRPSSRKIALKGQ